ncbi:sensor histidine kinase [Bacillus weihaiensis]|uniref:histidine kinase n=1 Tax=Bacillus weihaiensis TaxID=1547283 RepID=A0A1L3MVM2_9BACI|nr:HAMP domain-containing sensor histidine kinase [Bacillus weihaiensis]APH06384.1 hypothetical protein A9C19_17510 [Bacillus weihaiensis]
MSLPTSLIEQLLFNLLIILVPIYFFQWILPTTKSRINQVISISIFSIITLLTNLFTIESPSSYEELLWSLCYIPYVICILYIGKPALLVALFLSIFQLFRHGWIPFIESALLSFILFLTIYFIRNSYHRLNRRGKYFASIVLSTYTFSFMFIKLWIFSKDEIYLMENTSLKALIILFIGYLLAYILYTLFIETTHKTIMQAENTHHTEKLHMVSGLAKSIAYEMREPLTAVRGFIQLSRNGAMNQSAELLDTAIHELNRSENILKEYTMVSPSPSGEMKEFRLHIVMNEIQLLIQAYANHQGVKLTVVTERDIYVNGHVAKFKQAILSLLTYAINEADYGIIQVSATYCEKTDKVIVEMNKDQKNSFSSSKHSFPSFVKGKNVNLFTTQRLLEEIGGTLIVKKRVGRVMRVIISLEGRKRDQLGT